MKKKAIPRLKKLFFACHSTYIHKKILFFDKKFKCFIRPKIGSFFVIFQIVVIFQILEKNVISFLLCFYALSGAAVNYWNEICKRQKKFKFQPIQNIFAQFF